MNICIVHDSVLGNGERLANAMRERLNSAGHTAIVGHERTLTPAHALASSPELLIVGSAVRKFSLSPVTKQWIRALAAELERSDLRPRAAIFITHALRRSLTERKADRLQRRLVSVLGEEAVYPEWISARVTGQAGPFVKGAEAEAMTKVDAIVQWAAGPA